MSCALRGFLFLLLWHNVRTEDYITDVVIGQSAELPCNISPEDENSKLSILAWYKDGYSASFFSQDMRGGDNGSLIEGARDRFSLITAENGFAYLQIQQVQPSDAGAYHCYADFTMTPAQKTYSQLNVIEPPELLWVIHENGTEVASTNASSNASEYIGPYFIGDTIRLFCVSFGGNPKVSLSWSVGDEMVKNTSTKISEKRSRSDVEYGPLRSEDHGLVLSCQASNTDMAPPLAIDVIIVMKLPPELISVGYVSSLSDPSMPMVEKGVREGQMLRLQCRALGAVPTPEVRWRLNDEDLDLEQTVTVEQQQRLVVSSIHARADRTFDEAAVACCAPAHERRRGPDAVMCSKPLSISVLYAPVVNITVEGSGVTLNDDGKYAVQKHSNISILCNYEARPTAARITWFYVDPKENIDQSNKFKDHIDPVLYINDVTEEDSGEYICSVENDEGNTFGEPARIEIVYNPYCVDETINDYGVGENDFVNITCRVNANPEPHSYEWIVVNERVDRTAAVTEDLVVTSAKQTDSDTLLFQRPNGSETVTIICTGVNGVYGPTQPCVFWVTDKTFPLPPTDCKAVETDSGDISVSCTEGHDGGLPQRFEFNLTTTDPDARVLSHQVSLEPHFIIQEPKEDNYKFVIRALNEKGPSEIVEMLKGDIINATVGYGEPISAVTNITTLALALCGGVALVALAACGLVLCAQERSTRPDLPRHDPPLCAYSPDGDIVTVSKSNYDICNDSDDSEFNVRRTESFRRAMARYPSKNFDVQRTSSFHSARYMQDDTPEPPSKFNEMLKHSGNCRVHSMQNINRKREMDTLCDHLVMRLPPETNYQVSRPMNTFYTMPRKSKSKSRDMSDEVSEITQASDFSLPPPPDEFGTYRAATRIKDVPKTPTYSTIRKNSTGKDPPKQYNALPSMNTVGLPTVSGHHNHNSVYSYPDDEHHVSNNPFDEDSH